MTKMEKAHALHDKYEHLTEGMLLNTLWQILVNDVRKDVQSAFVYLYVPSQKGGANVGIVDTCNYSREYTFRTQGTKVSH